ncbi:MAG: excisionase family DNA-binding protein [Terracidiphilus sp.]|jgi:excisionase family DNA binding protein
MKREALGTLSAEEDPREILELYGRIVEMDARIAGGGGKAQELPASLYSFLCHVAGDLTAGRPVTILKDEVALTTVEAANTLGVSRQFLVQLLEQNEIPFHMVGTHRRVYARDILAFKGKRDSARRRPKCGLLWEDGSFGNGERTAHADIPLMKDGSWAEIKADVRDDLLAGDHKEPRIRLNALDRLEKDFAAIYPEFPADPAVLLRAGKDDAARKAAQMRVGGVLQAAESDVLGNIFRRLGAALVGV